MTRQDLLPARGCAYISRFFFAIALLCPVVVDAQTIRNDVPMCSGGVFAIEHHADDILLGGTFTGFGPNAGYGVFVDPGSGSVLTGYEERSFNGSINAVCPDGQGGFFIGGAFTAVSGQPRSGLARLNAQNQLMSWAPQQNGDVSDMVLSGDTLWVCGTFDSLNNAPQPYIAALDASSGSTWPWDPQCDGSVVGLAVHGSSIYATGNFSNVGGQPRIGLAGMDKFSGAVSPLILTLPGGQSAAQIEVVNGLMYMCGNFTAVNGISRQRTACVDLSSGSLTSFVADCTPSSVRSMAFSGDTLFVAGSFTNINGVPRPFLGAVDRLTGSPLSWAPSVGQYVDGLLVTPTEVYCGGVFTSAGGTPRAGLASFDRATGSLTGWDPAGVTQFGASCISRNGNGEILLAWGGLAPPCLNADPRTGVASLDLPTGQLNSFAPVVDGTVNSMAVRGDTLLIGGNFTTVDGAPRQAFAAFDLPTGTLLPWTLDAGTNMYALLISGDTLFIGGSFTTVNGVQRRRIAALDCVTGSVLPWDPNAGGSFSTFSGFVRDQNMLYVYGDFDDVGGVLRDNCAQFEFPSGALTNWSPMFNNDVTDLAVSNGVVYAVGDFTQLNGVAVKRVAALDATSGVQIPWTTDITGNIDACAVDGNTLFLSGAIRTIQQPVEKSMLIATGLLSGMHRTDWRTDGGFGGVEELKIVSGQLIAGGGLHHVNDHMHPGFAIIDLPCLSTDVVSASGATCPTGADGTASVTTAGGLPPYSYAWNTMPVQTGPTAVSLSAGIYTVSVEDSDTCQTSLSVLIPGPSQLIDHDLQVVLAAGSFRPGMNTNVFVVGSNTTCTAVNGEVRVVFDSLVEFVSAIPTPAWVLGDTVAWVHDSLVYGHPAFTAQMVLYTDTTAVVGDTICLLANIDPLAGDIDPSNNTHVLCAAVVNSYDPNDKSVVPEGQGPDGRIAPLQRLTYTIRFQNTGNAPAINVNIIDTLSDFLDPTTFQFIASSHPMTIVPLQERIVNFAFIDIMLPDSVCCEASSHGFVTFAISPMTGLANGTTIENGAAIFFDYNDPIFTNHALNTIDIQLGIEGQSDDQVTHDRCTVYPNPTAGRDMILRCAELRVGEFNVFDVFGRRCAAGAYGTDGLISLGALSPGTYSIVAGGIRYAVVLL